MNTVRCSSTGLTAASLTFARELRIPDAAPHDLRDIVENENFVSKILSQLRMTEAALRQAREGHEMTQDFIIYDLRFYLWKMERRDAFGIFTQIT